MLMCGKKVRPKYMLPKIGFIYGNDTEEVNIKIVGTMKQPKVLKWVHEDPKDSLGFFDEI